MNSIFFALGLMFVFDPNPLTARSFKSLLDRHDPEPFNECRVHKNVVEVSNVAFTIPFKVTNCDVLIADAQQVQLYLQQEFSDKHRRLKLYDYEYFDRYFEIAETEDGFLVKLNFKVLNESDFPPEISIRNGTFTYRKNDQVVILSSPKRELRVRVLGIWKGLCAYDLQDPSMDQLRNFQLAQTGDYPSCHVSFKEIAELSYRTNVSTKFTPKEATWLHKLGRKLNASSEQLEKAKARCWFKMDINSLYDCVKAKLSHQIGSPKAVAPTSFHNSRKSAIPLNSGTSVVWNDAKDSTKPDDEPLRECSVVCNTVYVPSVSFTIAFGVSNCDVLLAKTDDVVVYLREEFGSANKHVTIVYDNQFLEVVDNYGHGFAIRRNDAIIDTTNLPPELNLTKQAFTFQKYGTTVFYRTRMQEVKVVYSGNSEGLCGFHFKDPDMAQLRKFHLQNVLDQRWCHINLKEMAELSYRTNITMELTPKEKEWLHNLAEQERATPEQMQKALKECWNWVEPPGLYQCVKMKLEYPRARSNLVAVDQDNNTVRGILKVLLTV
ncbi:hypothetical protein L596_010825 [Steinernema carpocapsae]|uniref:VWFD domain-containing protein n=1 Tax=Steinernema carpocapsae TaxID=34508 RepID=A0A4U5PKE5_STECR|nr:hypothetical protein L596_010825 [Steinernema carpocapsae]